MITFIKIQHDIWRIDQILGVEAGTTIFTVFFIDDQSVTYSFDSEEEMHSARIKLHGQLDAWARSVEKSTNGSPIKGRNSLPYPEPSES